jgi:vancomycin permeability regulator SanA
MGRHRRLRRCATLCVCLGFGWFILHTAVSILVGTRDDIAQADTIIVFGNKVEENGLPSERLKARLDRALALYEDGIAPYMIVSGGFGKEGYDEAVVMRNYLVARNVPESSVIVDHNGNNSYLTAKNCTAIMRRRASTSAILVTQYYHILRARMAFRRFRITDLGHACARMGPEPREPLALAREFCAYYYYLLRKYEMPNN